MITFSHVIPPSRLNRVNRKPRLRVLGTLPYIIFHFGYIGALFNHPQEYYIRIHHIICSILGVGVLIHLSGHLIQLSGPEFSQSNYVVAFKGFLQLFLACSIFCLASSSILIKSWCLSADKSWCLLYCGPQLLAGVHLFSILLSITHHTFNFFIAQTG